MSVTKDLMHFVYSEVTPDYSFKEIKRQIQIELQNPTWSSVCLISQKCQWLQTLSWMSNYTNESQDITLHCATLAQIKNLSALFRLQNWWTSK